MISSTKNYKIIADSIHFGNMRGISPAEVAKKAAGKILGLSNDRNRITQFSMIETKNGKIRNYKAFKESLIRPYKKKGKLITCRIIVKKIGLHNGGGEAEILSEIYKKLKFTEEDKKLIKDAMFIENKFIDESKINYDPYNLSKTIQTLIVQGETYGFASMDFLKLGKNDPILQFFPISEFIIGFDLSNHKGQMTLQYIKEKATPCYISYEFTGDEESFELHIYNLSSCLALTISEVYLLKQNWEKYINFLKKLYPEADISFDYYFEVPFSNKNRNRLKTLKQANFNRYFTEDPNSNYNGT
jgi:hypothetical protein